MWKRSKYNAVKVFQHGRNWHSKLELAVYEMLLMMERGGAYKDIKCQVTVRFHTYDYGKITMIPDFSAIETKTNELVFIEAKGFVTRDFLRKKKAWAIGGPGKLYIYMGDWKYPKLKETIIPKSEAA
jgi:predicted nuclease of restriction endonuclease-like RecB superfamily